MLLWKLTRQRFAADTLSGEGARLHGGRWSSRGTPVVYAAGSRSLAQLEFLVHVDRADAPSDLVWVEIVLPDTAPVEDVDPSSVTPTWRSIPAPRELAIFGDDWAKSRRSLALRVPSAIEPSELNYLINPQHPEVGSVDIRSCATPHVFDARLFDVAPASAPPPRRRRPRRK